MLSADFCRYLCSCKLSLFIYGHNFYAGFVDETNGEREAKVSAELSEIVLELKKRVPPFTVFPTEKFFVPEDGEVYYRESKMFTKIETRAKKLFFSLLGKCTNKLQNSDCNPERTVHVDAFLYTDDDVDALVDDGDLQRNYCLDCGSKNTKPLSEKILQNLNQSYVH